MSVAGTITGFGLTLRAVAEDDAEAIVALRSDPELRRFIGETDPDPAAQREWIARQRRRSGDDYFAVLQGDELVGTVAAYDVDPLAGTCEWGRWVLRPGVLAAPGSCVLVLDYVFAELGLREVYSRTVAVNEQVVSFHDSARFPRSDRDEPSIVLHGHEVALVVHTVSRDLWAQSRSRLARLATAAERFSK